MKTILRIVLMTLLLSLGAAASAQSGLYVPSAKPIKDMQKALVNPQVFHLLLTFQGNDSTYTISHLDLLDSAYRIAFSEENPMLYTMVVESYAGARPSSPCAMLATPSIAPATATRSRPSASRCPPLPPSTTVPPCLPSG